MILSWRIDRRCPVGDHSTIEWTEATWNPIVGCSRVSPGCDHCYAERQSATRLSKVPAYAGLTGPDRKWTGEVRFLEERLDQPLRWRRPRRIFVNSMSDLFHPDVDLVVIARIFAVMAAAPRHTFQVLTKRERRMASILTRPGFRDTVHGYLFDLDRDLYEQRPWPIPNVWLGTSIESQSYAFRTRHLLDTPAAVRWISAEPLLGPLDLSSYLERGKVYGEYHLPAKGIDWVVVGGESGPGARPMHINWARTLRDQCQAAGVPFLFKQWGEYRPVIGSGDEADFYFCVDGHRDPLDARQFWMFGREPVLTKRYGKHTAGRELDGRTWDEYPR